MNNQTSVSAAAADTTPVTKEQLQALQLRIEVAMQALLEGMDSVGLNPHMSLQIDQQIRTVGLD